MTKSEGAASHGVVADGIEMKICSSELRTLTPLLRVEAVCAGDVLLTRARNRDARLIAKLSGGKYSHAALWLPVPDERGYISRATWFRLRLVEADDLGVGPTELRTMHLSVDGKAIDLVAQLPDVEEFVLLRHPKFKNITDTELANSSSEFCERELSRSYPSLDRLIAASSLPDAVKPLLRLPLSTLYYATAKDTVLHGSFCSELVAKFFRHVGLRIFDYEMEPGHVSPNHFVRSGCCLRPVPNAFITTLDIQDPSYATINSQLLKIQNLFSRQRLLPREVSRKAKSAHTTKLIDSFKTLAEARERRARKDIRQVQNSITSKLEASFLNPRPAETPTYRHISESLLARSLFARHLDLTLEPLENDHSIRDNLSKFCVVLWLRQRYALLIIELGRALSRHVLFYPLSVDRRCPGELPKQDRIKLIQNWQDIKISSYEAYERANNVFMPSEFKEIVQEEEAQTHIQSILHEVFTAASTEMRDKFYSSPVSPPE